MAVNPVRAVLRALTCLLVLAGEARAVGDPAAGEAVFQQFCRVCHGNASQNFNNILGSAGNPAAITAAFQRVPLMGFLPGVLTPPDIENVAAYLLAVATGPGPGPAPPPPPPPPVFPTVTVIEYYHPVLDHYFISALQPDIDALDSGRFPGWIRTGLTFRAYRNASEAPAGASPVCRFYIPPEFGDSHFYSASPSECEETRQRFPVLTFESAAVMYIHLPDAMSGACPFGTVAVFRMWNGRADSNHRYTTSLPVRMQMRGQGYVAEGYGPEAVIMCAPA
jgi:hypothetical protein